MIGNLRIMKDISPCLKRNHKMGDGKKGCELINDILSMGARQKGIWLCDLMKQS